MKLQIRTDFGLIKGGVSARSPQLGLVGHGKDRAEAAESLTNGIVAWCVGLDAFGALPKALQRAKLEPLNTAPGFQIELVEIDVRDAMPDGET